MFHSLPLLILASLLSFQAFSQFEPKTTVGGYGELHYNEPDGTRRGMLDFHRFVIYLGHSFTERLSFHSELEVEHTRLETGSPDGGELALEQAYLDYHLHRSFGFRAGILLLPVGIINQYHEPPTFHGVERPNVECVIIPSTWRETGAGVYGNVTDDLRYQAYVMAGLKAEGFSAANGIRGGRQEAFQSNPANPSFSARVDYSPLLGLQLGASIFAGNSAADEDSIGDATVMLWSADTRYSVSGFRFRAVAAITSISNVDKINAKFDNDVSDEIYGFYLEGAYNCLPLFYPESEQELFVFARFEKYDTQAGRSRFMALKQYDRYDVVFGLTYKPTYDMAFKFDYTFLNNLLNAGTFKNSGQLNLGLGYYFF